jgi:hypothetical protein
MKTRFAAIVSVCMIVVAAVAAVGQTLAVNSSAQTSNIVCPGSWKQVSSSGPAPRFFHELAFEPRAPHGEVVLFGGSDLSSNRMGDTWTWDGTVWIHAADAGPSPRFGSGMVYDFGRKRMVLFGGGGVPGNPYQDNKDTWEWDGAKWTEVAADAGPSKRNTPGMTYDGLRNKVVLFGGSVTFVRPELNDTWEWDGTAWTQRFPASAPSVRSEVGMAFDSAHARTVLFGGTDGISQDFGDTWTWDGTVWTQVANSGPEARRHPGMAYDSARHRTVLFGGANGETGSYFGDTWEWDGGRWTQLATTGPPARGATVMAYDKARGKSVLFGGLEPGVTLQDTWEWTGPIYACNGRAPGDLNCDGDVDREDLTIVESALGLPSCGAGDPRDLNQDGKINAQDAQLLVNSCTTLGCQ